MFSLKNVRIYLFFKTRKLEILIFLEQRFVRRERGEEEAILR
jgi:hypothetical protein